MLKGPQLHAWLTLFATVGLYSECLYSQKLYHFSSLKALYLCPTLLYGFKAAFHQNLNEVDKTGLMVFFPFYGRAPQPNASHYARTERLVKNTQSRHFD